MDRPDVLELANRWDEAWHDQARSFEREAVARFWGLLTLPARALDPVRPRAMLQACTVLRNARFAGAAVQRMFFADQAFTEVDAIFLGVGSALGHHEGQDAWVVEVERKVANRQADYWVAMRRARRFAELLATQFGVRARPVVIYEDDGGRLSYDLFEGDVLVLSMSSLRATTRGLRFSTLGDLPGPACDRTLVKVALLRALVHHNPHIPGAFASGLALARAVEDHGWSPRLPAVGHQDVDSLPGSVDVWLRRAREDDAHLAARVERYMAEMVDAGLLQRGLPDPRVSREGGDIILQLLRVEAESDR